MPEALVLFQTITVKKNVPLSLLFYVLFVFFIPEAKAAALPVTTITEPAPSLIDKLSSLTLKEAQQLAGRKFTLKKKIGFWLFKKQIRKGSEKGFSGALFNKILRKKGKKADDDDSEGKMAFGLGITALGTLLLGLFVPYVAGFSLIAAIMAIVFGSIAKKKNPDSKKGKIGKLLGWITVGLIIAAVTVVIVAIASWANG